MSTLSSLGKFLIAVTLSSASLQANAITYTVEESFNGTWEATWALPIATFTHTSSSQTLISGDTGIFTGSTTQSFSTIENVVNCVSCTITETLSNGDKIYFTHALADGVLTPSTTNPGTVDNYYDGNVTITGGTGLFSGAYGSGTFTAIDFGVYNIDGNGAFTSFNPNGNWQIQLTYTVTTPVPEPENLAMLLAGLGLIGFFARRKQHS